MPSPPLPGLQLLCLEPLDADIREETTLGGDRVSDTDEGPVCTALPPGEAAHNAQFGGYRAPGRLSAPRGETLLLFPPQPIERIMASAGNKRSRRVGGWVRDRKLGDIGCDLLPHSRHNHTTIPTPMGPASKTERIAGMSVCSSVQRIRSFQNAPMVCEKTYCKSYGNQDKSKSCSQCTLRHRHRLRRATTRSSANG